MKFILLLITTSIICLNSYAQRYLTPIFPVLDSTIGGIYGTAINNQAVNQDLLFDFYEPSGDTLLQRPLIIYIHGGGFTSGSRSYPSVKLLCQKMAQKGYAVANIDYRLDASFDLYNSTTDRRAMTDAMQDAKQAIRYFKANAGLYKIDTSKVFIGGESAGAVTAMMSSFIDKQSEMTSYPMANPNNPVGSNSNSSYGNGVAGTLCLCGLLLDTNAMETSNDSPILWTHGSADTFIPLVLSFNIVLRAAHIGLPIQTKVYQGGVHCPWYYGNPNWDTYLDSTINDITSFLYPRVSSTVGIPELETNNIVENVYPNPTNHSTTIKLDRSYENVSVTISSHLGQTIKTIKLQHINSIPLNMNDLESGIYWISLNVDHQNYHTKLIKTEK